MSRMLRVGPLVTAALIAFVAHGESPAEWTRHASVRWDLGSVKDVDFVGDTGLLLAIDGYWDDADAPGFIVWDPDTKRLVRSIPADVAGIVVHTVSLDGSRIAGASATVAKVWDAATGEELLALGRAPGRSPEANAVALSRDGSRLAACVGANRVEVWDVTTRKRLAAVEADPLAGCVGITPDGALLAAAGVRHHRVRTWDVASGKELDVYGGYRRRVRALVFSADGQTMVTGDGSGAATVWDMPGGKRIHTLNAVDSPVTSVAVSRGASVVAMGGLKGEAVLWDLAADPPRETQRLHGSGAAAVALRPDGAMLASASARLDLWPDSASTTARGGRDRYAWGGDLRVNASGTRALTTHGNGAVTLWDTERGASLATFATPAASEEPIPNALGSWRVFTGFTADGSAFRIVHHTGAVLVCDAATGEIRGTFAIGPLYTYSSVFARGMTRFASIDEAGRAKVWDLEERRLVGVYAADPTPSARSMRAHLSPRGHALAVTAGRGQATVWDLRGERGPWTFGVKNGLPRHIPSRNPQRDREVVERIVHVADDAATLLTLSGGRLNLWDVLESVVVRSDPITGGSRGGPMPLLSDGRSRALLISYPSYLWSSEEPRVLQAMTLAPDKPLAFDADGRLTQDFRAPRDDLAVAYWPPGPGGGKRQYAGHRSRDGRIALTHVGSRGFDVWRLSDDPE